MNRAIVRWLGTGIVVAFALLTVGATTRSVEPMVLDPLLGPKPLQNPPGLAGTGSGNIDFRTAGLLAPIGSHAVAYRAAQSLVYTGNKRTFSVYSVLDPTHPSLLGRIEIPATQFDGGIFSLFYPGSGDYVYATVSADGLYAIRVQNPSAPVITDSISSPGLFLYVSGGLAYMGAFAGGLQIVNVSDPNNLTFVGSYDPSQGFFADVWYRGGYVYMVVQADLFAMPNVWVFDVTNPAMPVVVSGGSGFNNVTGLTGSGNRLYITSTDIGLTVADLTNPAAPSYLGSASGFGYGNDVEVSGGLAYVATSSGFDVVNVSNPASQTLFGRLNSLPSYANVYGMALGTSLAFLASSRGGLQIVDIASPSAPSVITTIPSPGSVHDVFALDNYAYYACTQLGLFIVDTSIISRPRLVGTLPLEYPVNRIHVVGNTVYWGDQTGLRIIDVTNRTNPVQLGFFATSSVNGLDIVGTRAYLANGSNGLRIVNVSNPAAPVLLGGIVTGSNALDVKVVDNLAYVADGNDGLRIYNVANPAAPVFVGSFDTPNYAVGVDVVGRYAYVADEASYVLFVIDVLDPAHPVIAGQYFASDNVEDVLVVGDLAYVSTRFAGLRILDVSLPFAPFEVGYYETEDPFYGVGFQGGYAFTAESDGGGSILHYADQCFDGYEPNDQFSSAYPILDGAIYSPKICDQNDVDFFEIATPGGGTIDITMQPPPGKDYNLYLYDTQHALITSSVTSGDAAEHISHVITNGGPFYVRVAGNVGEFDSTRSYNLHYIYQPCPAPTTPVYIYSADLDENGNIVLYVQDPNQPARVTGYNLYRATHGGGPFIKIGENLTDFDAGRPNIQIVDTDSSGGGLFFYKITAFNGQCNAEGPQ